MRVKYFSGHRGTSEICFVIESSTSKGRRFLNIPPGVAKNLGKLRVSFQFPLLPFVVQ
jgi:hypothetical protein